MVRRTITITGLALTLSVASLGGCGPAADDPAQGEVSAGEAKALNDAATMLDNGDKAMVITNADEGAGNVE